MSFDPFAYEREEERDAARFYTGPDDPDRPDPSEYQEPSGFIAFSKTLDCGCRVEASEESGGFDEVPRVTEAMVRGLLDFRIRVHNCGLTDVAGSPGIGPDMGPF